MMTAYYNEHEAYPAQWLRNLAEAGHITEGVVDERSITELRADDLRGFERVHTFAGIGVWEHALRLAGWPADRNVWTGSCPCQPFSVAGRGRGTDDERHLWPVWRELIRECRPSVVFGEQVGSPAGRAWLDAVSADLEAMGYAVGAAGLPACSVGAPHIRQRIFFGAARMANADDPRLEGRRKVRQRADECAARSGGVARRLGHADRERAGWHGGAGAQAQGGALMRAVGDGAGSSGADAWSRVEWLACRDGVARPAQPGIHPLAHGTPARVGKLRAYGNAIVPQAAAAFVVSFMQALEDVT